MAELAIDAGSAALQGARERQEDALRVRIAAQTLPFALLSDGMGGHSGGDLAARIIVSEAAQSLSRGVAAKGTGCRAAPQHRSLLLDALAAANAGLCRAVASGHGQPGMGGTLVVAVLADGMLRWLSVGDSGLFLLRGDRLHRLNADHSMAAEIDALAARGLVRADVAARHPQRSCLTSALTGGEIARLDCPEQGVALEPGDAVVLVSDGALSPGLPAVTAALLRARPEGGAAMARAVAEAVDHRAMPDQDNASIVVLTVAPAGRAAIRSRAARALRRLAYALRPWRGATAGSRA